MSEKNRKKQDRSSDISATETAADYTQAPDTSAEKGINIPNKALYAILIIAVIALAVMSVILITGYSNAPNEPHIPIFSPVQSNEHIGTHSTSEEKPPLSPEQTTDEPPEIKTPEPPKYTIADTLRLDVENIYQLPDLPNGCEVTSLAIVLNYLGYEIDPLSLYLDHMPKSDYEYGDPWTTYKGEATGLGLGCYAPCVVTTGNSYLSHFDSEYITKDVSYKTIEHYKLYLNLGYPVIFWGMLDMQWNPSIAWGRNVNGQTCIWHAFSHCLVLIGYTNNQLIFCDPLNGIRYYSEYNSLECFTAMFKQACVITEADTDLDKIYEAYEEGKKQNIPEDTTGPDATTRPKETGDDSEPYNPYDDIDFPGETNPPGWDDPETETPPPTEDIIPDETEEETLYDDIIPEIPEDTEEIIEETLPEDEIIDQTE